MSRIFLSRELQRTVHAGSEVFVVSNRIYPAPVVDARDDGLHTFVDVLLMWTRARCLCPQHLISLSLGPPHFSPVSTRVDLQLLRLDFVGAMLGAGKMHCERHVFSGVSRTGPSAHLMRDKMREAIRGHQRSSEVGHQRSSGRSGGSPSSDWGRALPERDSRIFTSGDAAPLRSTLRPQRSLWLCSSCASGEGRKGPRPRHQELSHRGPSRSISVRRSSGCCRRYG